MMPKLVINTVDEFQNLTDKELGVSEWLTINQTMIDHFADATLDHQWIHIDSQRAKEGSPFGSTIAHGYLLVSLIPHFLEQIFSVSNLDHIVNYGIDKLVFKAPVPVNSRLRMRAFIKSSKDLGGICLAQIQCVMEIEDSETPVLEGVIKYLYYFK